MNRKLFLLIIVLLAVVALPASWAAAEPSATDATESEPNDVLAQADPVAIGDTTATIAPVGDVDYYKLSLAAGQRVYLAALADCGYSLKITLAVLDAGGVTIATPGEWPDGNIVFDFVAPAAGDYYVRVQSPNSPYHPEETTGPYTLLIRNVPADERNDSYETAAPIAWGTDMSTDIYAPYDLDYYRIHARPGDVIEVNMTVDEVDPDGAWLYIDNAEHLYPYGGQHTIYQAGTASITFVVPFEADYIVHPIPVLNHCEGLDLPLPYELTVDRLSLHVGAANAGTVDGVAFGVNDIMARNAAGQWRKVFDGEDVGLTAAINGFEWMQDGSLLLALKAGQSLPSLGQVKPQDVVRFTPTQLGNNTQGAFSFYLRGSQAGLTGTGEKIDAIALMADGGLLISTTGSASVPKFGGGTVGTRDEDLLLFHPGGPMPSAGTWSVNMDGTKYMSKFGTLDLGMATVADDYEDPEFEPFYHYTTLWFGVDKTYKYVAWENDGYQRLTAAPGDLMRGYYYEETYNGPYGAVTWRPLTRATLGFPKLITSISIGP